MRTKGRSLFVILFGAPLLLAAPVFLLGSWIVRDGMMEIHILQRDGGSSVDVSLPAAVVPAAAGMIRVCGAGEAECRIDAETREALRIAADVLSAMRHGPDGVLVDIRTRDEVVHVEKLGGSLQLHVDTPEELVRVKVPLGAARAALDLI